MQKEINKKKWEVFKRSKFSKEEWIKIDHYEGRYCI